MAKANLPSSTDALATRSAPPAGPFDVPEPEAAVEHASAALAGLTQALGSAEPEPRCESAAGRLRREMRRLTDCAREAEFGAKLRAAAATPAPPAERPAAMDADVPAKRSADADAVGEAFRETVVDERKAKERSAAEELGADTDAGTDTDAGADTDADADADTVADTDTAADTAADTADAVFGAAPAEEPLVPATVDAAPLESAESAAAAALDAEVEPEPETQPAAIAGAETEIADFDESDMASAIEELLRSDLSLPAKSQPVAQEPAVEKPRGAAVPPSHAPRPQQDDSDELADMAAAINELFAAGPASLEAPAPEAASEPVAPVVGIADAPAPTPSPDATPPAAPAAAAASAGFDGADEPSERRRSMTSLDQALADDIDTLLAGDVGSVGAILDEIFDEEAIVVQDVEDDLTLMPDFCCDDGALTERQADDMLHSGGSALPIDAAPEAGAGESGSTQAPEANADAAEAEPDDVLVAPPSPVDGADEPESDAGAAPEAEAVEVAVAAPEVIVAGDSEDRPTPIDDADVVTIDEVAIDEVAPAAREPEPASKPVVAVDGLPGPRDAAVEVDLDQPAAGSSVAAADARGGRPGTDAVADDLDAAAGEAGARSGLFTAVANALRPIGAMIGPIARRALEGANYPLRYVPPAVRPIVDWLALSLLFWVPIIWFIALFVVG